MRRRSRAHEASSVEAGSSISKSIFFANRVVGAFACRNRASQGAQERTGQPNRASQGAQERAGQSRRASQPAQPEPASKYNQKLGVLNALRRTQPGQPEPGGPGRPSESQGALGNVDQVHWEPFRRILAPQKYVRAQIMKVKQWRF